MVDASPPPAGLGPEEAAFVAERDSFYLATVGEAGWPYVQHRGGPVGFIHVVDATHLAWVERAGNRQFVTAGNLDYDDRAALIAVDYPNRRRLKLLGHARWSPDPHPDIRAALSITGRIEGLVTMEVVAFDWNCPKFITPRYTAEQVRELTSTLTARITDLEAQLTQSIEPRSDPTLG
jgi:predicted pyridoxine 5'-phosphate oxidase superfamily flavin-nucleotide-binding protein